MNVFFYGLFMDEAVLAEKGIIPADTNIGHVDGVSLRIGERATLVPSVGSRSYGVLMTISSDEASELYAESSVADYVPELVVVDVADGNKVEATCYNLPLDKVTGTNTAYAEALWEVADKLGLPKHYLAEIRQAGQ